MSASLSGPNPNKHGKSQDEPIDIDMTPMMNMLIILISFLVTMVVFTQLAVIQFELPSNSQETQGDAGTESADSTPETNLTLVVSEGGFQIIGEGKKQDPIPKISAGYDFKTLDNSLAQLRAQYPAAVSMVLLIEPFVLYQDIITTMDVCRARRFPDVLLSGGLSE